jgi:hypothetical protein
MTGVPLATDSTIVMDVPDDMTMCDFKNHSCIGPSSANPIFHPYQSDPKTLGKPS